MPDVELRGAGGDEYQVEYFGFVGSGTYQVVVYALDDEGNARRLKWIETEGTRAPFNCYLPLVLKEK